MAIPSFDECLHPLLRVLAKHPDGVRARDAVTETADDIGITEEERRTQLPSGRQPLYYNRIAWAHQRLKSGGLSSSPRWGVWTITAEGQRTLRDHPAGFDEPTLRKLMTPDVTTDDGDVPTTPAPATDAPISTVSPEEQIGNALRQIRESVAQEIHDLLVNGTPEFFELVVLDVLRAMGYGASDQHVQHVGKSGDGGIDGVIALDRLGLQKVGVQAKRWLDHSVGRPDVQAFYGALAQRRAQHGVMITLSTFSREAREFAEHVSDKIVLVDGEQLTRLMIDHGVGVTSEVRQVPKIDRDYFEEA